MYRVDGHQRRATFAPTWPTLTLRDARLQAGELFAKVHGGVDPKAEMAERKRRAELEAKAGIAYAEVVEDFIQKEAIGRNRNTSWREQQRYLVKHGGGFDALRDIHKRDIQGVLDHIMARGKGYSANQTYAHWRKFFRWCHSRDLISVNPMDGVEKPFAGETKRTRTFNNGELSALWRAADQLPPHMGAFLKLLLLLGKRKRALSAMRRDEIDDNWVWSPPQPTAVKAGNKRTHPTPLPKLAQRVLKGLPDAGMYVFPGRTGGGHFDPQGWLAKRIVNFSGVDSFFFHAARHTVETRMAELGILPHIRDWCLDHAPARGSGAGYDHHKYIPEMRAAFEAWANALEAVVTPKGARRLR